MRGIGPGGHQNHLGPDLLLPTWGLQIYYSKSPELITNQDRVVQGAAAPNQITLATVPILIAALLPCLYGVSLSWNLVLALFLPLCLRLCPQPAQRYTGLLRLTPFYGTLSSAYPTTMRYWAPHVCQLCYWGVSTCGGDVCRHCSTCHKGHSPAPLILHPEWQDLLWGPFHSRLPQPWCTSPFLVSIFSSAHKLEACLSDPRVSYRSNIVQCSDLIYDHSEHQRTCRELTPALWLS